MQDQVQGSSMRTGYIYKITIGTKYYYYGQTVDPVARRAKHLRQLKKNKHANRFMQRCFNKYLDFDFEIVETGCADDLDAMEQVYISKYVHEADCMNIAMYAQAPFRGLCHTEDTKARISASKKGKMTTEHKQSLLESRQQVCFGRPVGTTEWIQFSSHKEGAERAGTHRPNVSKCILNKRKTAGGWEWRS